MIKIIGAGMAGMLAANMLRKDDPVIYEIKEKMPNNHGALLRFRSKAVSDATCIEFKEVTVTKAIYDKGYISNESNILFQNLYSKKVIGEYKSRSIMNLNATTRYIAPDDFIEKCSSGLDIKFGDTLSIRAIEDSSCPIISTVPMPILARILNYNDFDFDNDFKSRAITSYRLKLDSAPCDLYQTYYIPNDDFNFYRVSITGDMAIFETSEEYIEKKISDEQIVVILRSLFGIEIRNSLDDIEIVRQHYGKIVPADTKKSRKFVSWATNNYGVYSLGRFATWRQILMDDCVNDVKAIQKMIKTENYER